METYDTGYSKTKFGQEKIQLFLRLIFALVFLVFVHLEYLQVSMREEIKFPLLYILTGIYIGYAVGMYLMHDTFDLRGSRGWMPALLDICFLCTAIYLSGGVESHTFLFLGLVPLIGGIYRGYRGTFFSAILVLVGFSIIVAVDTQHAPDYNYMQAVSLRYAYLIGACLIDAYLVDLILKDRNRLRIFYEISQSSSKSPALYNVLKEITQRMAEALKSEVAVVFLYNEATGALEAQQPSLGLDFISTTKLKVNPTTPGIISNCFRNDDPVLVSRRLSQGKEIAPFYPHLNVFDLVACPLVARGKNIGLIALANKLNRRGFSRRDLTLTKLLAPHISIFLDNALLYRGSEEKVAQLTSLIRVVDAINTVSSLDQLYNLALDVIRGLFAVEKALINIISSQTGLLETVRSFGYNDQYISQHLSQPFEQIALCYVLKHDATFLCLDVAKDKRCPNMVVDHETQSMLCVPIRSGKQVYGILHMASRYRNAFDEEDETLANAIGEQIGMAVESARLFNEISRLAITDALTGLYNVRHLRRVLGEEVKRSIRYGRPLSFIMIDIDFFKIYNDQHGHPRGDEALRILAGLLQQNTRDVDTVFRYGGEEFSVIIPEVEKQEASSMAERIRRVIQDHVFPYEEDQPGSNFTVSMGVANLPDDAGDGEELIDKADRALYRAKHSGRNMVCEYDAAEDKRALHPRIISTAKDSAEGPESPEHGSESDDGERKTG